MLDESVVKFFPKVVPEWNPEPGPTSKFRLEAFDTIEPGRLPWRVKGLWPAVGVCFVAGPSMSGKSFWVLDALARVRRGLPVLGRKSVPAGVVYVAAEGAAGVRKRITGLRAQIGPLGGSFDFIGQAPNLTDPEDVEALGIKLRQAKEDQAANGVTLGVVCIDTLSASIPGADENNAKDMSPVLTALQALAADLDVLVLVVAHTGKDESRGLRGWSGLLANADGLVMLTLPSGDQRSGEVVKVKDGEAGDSFGFVLRQVGLGRDDDGDAITTCVVDHTDAPERPSAGRKPVAAEQDATTLRQAFNRIFPDKAAVIQAPGANGAQGVLLSDLRAEAFKMGLGPVEPDYASLDAKQAASARKAWTDHRNKSFNRAKEKLIGAGGYRIENDWIWEFRRHERKPR